jgi:hypothetical protein
MHATPTTALNRVPIDDPAHNIQQESKQEQPASTIAIDQHEQRHLPRTTNRYQPQTNWTRVNRQAAILPPVSERTPHEQGPRPALVECRPKPTLQRDNDQGAVTGCPPRTSTAPRTRATERTKRTPGFTVRTIPQGHPPTEKRMTWDTGLGTDNSNQPERRTTFDRNSLRRSDEATKRTNRRITITDAADLTTLGEFPFRHYGSGSGQNRYLPSSVLRILPSQLVGPDDFFDPGPDFLNTIHTIMQRTPPTPHVPPFRFGVTGPDLEHNAAVLSDANFDFNQLLPLHQQTTLGFGSEFRPLADLALLLSRHPHFPFVASVLTGGMDYHFHDGSELTESERTPCRNGRPAPQRKPQIC